MTDVVQQQVISSTNRMLSARFAAAAWLRVLSVSAFASGFAYLSLRFILRDSLFDSVVANSAVPAALYLLATSVFYLLADVVLRCAKRNNGHFLKIWGMSIGLILLAILALPALAKHFTTGLAILADIHSPEGRIYKWDSRGFATVRDKYNLAELHRQGDEVAHLAAAQAVMVSGARPSIIAGFYAASGAGDFRYDRKYWVSRALRGHPPGVAMMYSLACGNAVFARVVAALLTSLTAVLCYWAANKWEPDRKLGLIAIALFLGIPNLVWWHGMSVSSDIPPCLFTFPAFGLLATATLGQGEKLRCGLNPNAAVVLAGLLMGIGTFVTYTAALSAAASAALILTQPNYRQRLLSALWLLAPAGVAVIIGIWYSHLIFKDGEHVLVSRLTSLVGREEVAGFISGGRAALIFVKRLPMDLGWPMVILFTGALIWQVVRQDANVFTRASQLLIAGLVLIPAAVLFWPEIRFAYPGWLLVCYGLGIPELWKRMSNFDRSLAFGSLLGFSYTKFVMLRLAVAAG